MENNNWKEFNYKSDFRELNNNTELKLVNNKTVSIGYITPSKVLDRKGEEIDLDDVLFFRAKKDFNRYKNLQQYNKVLSNDEYLDELDWAITSSLNMEYGEDNSNELQKAFELIKEYSIKAQEQIINESKTYL